MNKNNVVNNLAEAVTLDSWAGSSSMKDAQDLIDALVAKDSDGSIASAVETALAASPATLAAAVATNLELPTFGIIDEVVDLTGNAALYKAISEDVPAGAVILSVQANIDATVTGGSTTVKIGIGLNASDPDKYGLSGNLAQNTKINTTPALARLSADTTLDVCACATNGAAGDTNITAGKVHVKIVYQLFADLADTA